MAAASFRTSRTPYPSADPMIRAIAISHIGIRSHLTHTGIRLPLHKTGQSQIHHMNEAHQGDRGCRPLTTSDRKPNESSGLIPRRAYFKIIYEMTRPSTEAAYLGGRSWNGLTRKHR